MVKKLWILFILVLIATLIGDFYMHPHNKFEIANLRFFNAIFGFSSCAAIVFVSKILGVFLKRKENYYKEIREDE